MFVEPAVGKILRLDERGALIHVPLDAIGVDKATLRAFQEVSVGFMDGRGKTGKQCRLAFALMNEIGLWNGDDTDGVYYEMLYRYNDYLWERQGELFQPITGISKMDVTTLRHFISFLIRFCVAWVPNLSFSLLEKCEDIDDYLYACLMNKRCAICGEFHADLHHAEDRVGMGRNREKIVHEGMRVMALCRAHHMECHDSGQAAFNEKYHVHGLPATREVCIKWGLKYKCA